MLFRSLVGGGAAEDVDVPAGLVAYPQRFGSHVGYVMLGELGERVIWV